MSTNRFSRTLSKTEHKIGYVGYADKITYSQIHWVSASKKYKATNFY